MYERNAIVIERYFSQLFGYNDKSNLKVNYNNYIDLVDKIEKYQEVTKEEDAIIAEYDQIIGRIKEIQRNQDILYKKNLKMQETRRDIFENIDENVDGLRKRLEKLEEDIQKNDQDMKENGIAYISELTEFNDKSIKRSQCSKNRRIIEGNYQNKLKETINNINGIKPEKVEEIRDFFKSENNIQEEIQNKVMKNGEREKIPFDLNVIEKSIDIQIDIEEKEVEILGTVYDRIHRLFAEIKNDTIKIEKHKKLIKDSESKMNFLNAMKDYLTLFLDNERLNIVGGEKEHRKLMDEACNNLEKDFVQITNLYTLLIKEMTGKASKKMYKDSYHPEYLYDLEEQEKEFENNISRLNVIGTVIYPDYWRIEGMQKIFASFKESIEKVYGRDLSEYEPVTIYNRKLEKDIIQESGLDDYDGIDYDDEQDDEKLDEIFDQEDEDDNFDDEVVDSNDENEDEFEDDDSEEDDFDEEEFDDDNFEEDEFEEDKEEEKEKEREIDQILGFYNFDDNITDDEDDKQEDEEDVENEQEDEEDYEYGFDEDDGYDDIDFDEDDIEEDTSPKSKKK